jgi:hypothetical protein
MTYHCSLGASEIGSLAAPAAEGATGADEAGGEGSLTAVAACAPAGDATL